MKWAGDLSEETMEFESRWVHLRRRFQRLLVVVFLCILLAFLTLHPVGRQVTSAGLGAVQTIWQWAEWQLVHHFGPVWILRLRARWASDGLEDELVRLQALEQRSTRIVETVNGELPPLLEAQEAVYQEILALTAQLQQTDAPAITALLTNAPSMPSVSLPPSNLSAQVMTYIDLAEQVERRRQTVRVLAATVVQSRALQQEAQQLITDAEAMHNLFAALLKSGEARPVESELTTNELLAMRTALQVQITRTKEIHNMRHALEASLNALNLPVEPPALDRTYRVEANPSQVK